MIVIRVLGYILQNDFFCEKAECRAATAFGLWLFFLGSEGTGADAMPDCHFATGAIFKLCKDFYGYGLESSTGLQIVVLVFLGSCYEGHKHIQKRRPPFYGGLIRP